MWEDFRICSKAEEWVHRQNHGRSKSPKMSKLRAKVEVRLPESLAAVNGWPSGSHELFVFFFFSFPTVKRRATFKLLFSVCPVKIVWARGVWTVRPELWSAATTVDTYYQVYVSRRRRCRSNAPVTSREIKVERENTPVCPSGPSWSTSDDAERHIDFALSLFTPCAQVFYTLRDREWLPIKCIGHWYYFVSVTPRVRDQNSRRNRNYDRRATSWEHFRRGTYIGFQFKVCIIILGSRYLFLFIYCTNIRVSDPTFWSVSAYWVTRPRSSFQHFTLTFGDNHPTCRIGNSVYKINAYQKNFTLLAFQFTMMGSFNYWQTSFDWFDWPAVSY